MKILYRTITFFMAFSCVSAHVFAINIEDKAIGGVIGSAIGDALGRITEFQQTIQEIKQQYGQNGLTSFNQFHPQDWVNNTALYTDDTVMAKILLEEAVKGRENNFPINMIMSNYAQRCIELFGQNKYVVDPYYNMRAHGAAGPRACDVLRPILKNVDKRTINTDEWWNRSTDHSQANEIQAEGGCGSVMRVWPLGLVFYDNMETLKQLADKQSIITHRHPMARAASMAMAVGTAQAMYEEGIGIIIQLMGTAASALETEEKYYNPALSPGDYHHYNLTHRQLIRDNKLSTSNMIHYAYQAARAGYTPEQVLGTHNKRQSNYRSTEGFLLGWSADEAVAAAVYIFARHPKDLKKALAEAVNTPGDSDSIGALVGALVGTYSGINAFDNAGFDYSKLENKDALIALAKKSAVIAEVPYQLGIDNVPVITNNKPNAPLQDKDEQVKSWSFTQKLLGGTVIVGGITLVVAAVYGLWYYFNKKKNQKHRSSITV